MKIKSIHQQQYKPFEENQDFYEDYDLVYSKRRIRTREEYPIWKNTTGLTTEEIADKMGWNSFFGRDVYPCSVTVYID